MKQMFFLSSLAFSMIQNVGNLISGSSACSKFTLYIWKFSVHMLLKPSLKDFEHYFARMWNECNCTVLWTFIGTYLLWNWKEYWPFQSCGNCWVFQICWHIECSTLTASYFRIWNSSAGIPSLQLVLFIAVLPRQWHPTPALLPGKSHGRRSLVGCSPWDRKESDTTEQLHFTFTFSFPDKFSSVQSLSCVRLFATLWIAAR